VIGPYKLLEQIGEGGCGVVYMAEQQHPVRRRVALKVIKPGLDSRQVIARFEAERQALALMEHENVAKVFDAGATESGRPYFVMELVHGVSITEYCDRNRLPAHERIALFVQVCRAVQHAHTKGVIHRDIKPTNVLVTLHEGVAVPKVIDFGVAKATGPALTEKTVFTQFATMVGTPLYMSPEQAELTGIDVDTRTDVYSLGVLLYELLTGTTPLDKERLKAAAFDEMRRILREEDPPRPSIRISTMAEQARSVTAAQRRSDPRRLGLLVRGDLDWIVMKALEKDRNRRYETASGFATDLERYLADEPVLACPPSALYRIRKFVRRHRGAVVAAALLLLTLAGGVVGTSLGLVRAAERAAGERRAKERAQTNFDLATEAVEKYLGTVTDDPALEPAEFLPLRRRLLESAVPFFERIAAQQGDDPTVESNRRAAHLRLGALREALGDDEAAVREFEAARASAARDVAAHPGVRSYRGELVRTQVNSAMRLGGLGRSDEAAALLREATATIEALAAEAPLEPRLREFQAGLLEARGSEEDLRRSAGIWEDLFLASPDAPNFLDGRGRVHTSLGLKLISTGKFAEAEAELRWVLDLYTRNPRDAQNVGRPFPKARRSGAYAGLGLALVKQGKLAEAEPFLIDAARLVEELAVEFPARTGVAWQLGGIHSNLGFVCQFTGRAKAALDWYGKAVARFEPLLAREPRLLFARRYLATTHNGRGRALLLLGRNVEALAAYEEGLSVLRATPGSDEPKTTEGGEVLPPALRDILAEAHRGRATALKAVGRLPQAEAALLEAIHVHEELVAAFGSAPETLSLLGMCRLELANLMTHMGRPDTEAAYRRARDDWKKLASEHPDWLLASVSLARTETGLATMLSRLERYEDAEASLRRATGLLQPLVDRLPGWELQIALAEANAGLGTVLQAKGSLPEAEEAFLAAVGHQQKVVADARDVPDFRASLAWYGYSLGCVRFDRQSPREALTALREAAVHMERLTEDFPATAGYGLILAGVRCKIAQAMLALGEHEASLEASGQAVASLRPLVAAGVGGDSARMGLRDGVRCRAEAQDALGRVAEALDARREALALCREYRGPDHEETFGFTVALAESLLRHDRGAEAISLIDDVVKKGSATGTHGDRVVFLLGLRLRHFQAKGDATACRETAEMLERLNRSDMRSLYDAACYWAITAAVRRASERSEAALRSASSEADLAMDRLGKALAAGFDDFAYMEKDADLNALRDREDFRKLLGGMRSGR
jgi:tetratricopeptide (TPR) repeat protein/tRNA A-37 threonylcarbamoyl transferase component Bud32